MKVQKKTIILLNFFYDWNLSLLETHFKWIKTDGFPTSLTQCILIPFQIEMKIFRFKFTQVYPSSTQYMLKTEQLIFQCKNLISTDFTKYSLLSNRVTKWPIRTIHLQHFQRKLTIISKVICPIVWHMILIHPSNILDLPNSN